MIRGAAKWNDKDTMYSQSNNPTEALLLALKGTGGWLESCGPTTAVNCLAARGADLVVTCPGAYRPQPEEVLMDYFNDPRNKDVLDAIRKTVATIPENRVPQFYPQAVYAVFGQRASFRWSLVWDVVAKWVSDGYPVQVCFKNPGHYVAVVAYDDSTDELIYNDSWGERFADGKGGWHRRMGKKEFESNVQNYFIIYGV